MDLGIPADGAKVIVVKFNDYQCPVCRATHEWYKPVLEKFEQANPGAVKYILKDWPWNTKCNVNAAARCMPARVKPRPLCGWRATAGQGQGRRNGGVAVREPARHAASPDEVKAAAQKILGVTDFDRAVRQKLPAIRRDIADGVALRISATPTLFINGVRIEDHACRRHISNWRSSSS